MRKILCSQCWRCFARPSLQPPSVATCLWVFLHSVLSFFEKLFNVVEVPSYKFCITTLLYWSLAGNHCAPVLPVSSPNCLPDWFCYGAETSRRPAHYSWGLKCPTRDTHTLDHCYTALKDADHPVPRAALGLSDHFMVHLLPTYKQNLKSAKPVVKTVRRWTTEAKLELQDCFDYTAWSGFEAAATDLDELTDTDIIH